MNCPSCNVPAIGGLWVHEPGCSVAATARQDTRKTSPEKLEKMRELMNEMARVAAREPNDAAMQQLARFSERGHRILDGEWD